MKTVTITEFRKNIFQMIDEALATGEAIEIRRKGGKVVVSAEEAPLGVAEKRAERWKRFWESPPVLSVGGDLSAGDVRRAREEYWHWDEEPELNL
ncbi:MAG: type II toxin-antitoxin system Phd/YefM family antitoxin [Caulobacteraceae bacterium]